MVIGLLVLTSIPAVTGISLAVSQQRAYIARRLDEQRMRKFNVSVYCDSPSSRTKEIHNKMLILQNERVYIDDINPKKRREPAVASASYLAEAFYIEYPDPERVPMEMGLVSQVSDDPPLLNWLYIDKRTYELKYGNRSESREHHVGNWDWTEDGIGVTFAGAEAFVAVEGIGEDQGAWQVYFDGGDEQSEALKRQLGKRRKIEISLERRMVDGQPPGIA